LNTQTVTMTTREASLKLCPLLTCRCIP